MVLLGLSLSGFSAAENELVMGVKSVTMMLLTAKPESNLLPAVVGQLKWLAYNFKLCPWALQVESVLQTAGQLHDLSGKLTGDLKSSTGEWHHTEKTTMPCNLGKLIQCVCLRLKLQVLRALVQHRQCCKCC